MIDYNTMDEATQIAAVKADYKIIKLIADPSDDVQLEAVHKNRRAIEFIKNPTEDVQFHAMSGSGTGENIRHIANPSELAQLMAVAKAGVNIQHIKKPTENVQYRAVLQDSNALQYVENPSLDTQRAAFQTARLLNRDGSITRSLSAARQLYPRDGSAIKFIENPSEEVQILAINHCGPRTIIDIKDPSDATQRATFAVAEHFHLELLAGDAYRHCFNAAIIDEIKPGLSVMRETAYAMTENEKERRSILEDFLAQAPSEEMDLPLDLNLS